MTAGSETGTGTSTTGDTEAPFDPTPWVGFYHHRDVFTPFGEPGDPVSPDPILSNLEIRPDFTAHMLWEHCSMNPEKRFDIDYVWGPSGTDRIEFGPGPGESSLRMAAFADLAYLRARAGDTCDTIVLEYPYLDQGPTEATWYAGEACWINRCEDPPDEVHIDYCDDDEPTPCD